MSDRSPIETTNLDQYGHAALPWSRPRDLLAAGPNGQCFLSTVGSDGAPHAAGIGPRWHEDVLYFVSGPNTRKARNLAANPACTVALALEGIDLVLEGIAERVTDPELLDTLAAAYRNAGWPAEVAGDALTAPYTAPSGGPPPWNLYRLPYRTAFGVAGAEPHGATRWQFAPESTVEEGS